MKNSKISSHRDKFMICDLGDMGSPPAIDAEFKPKEATVAFPDYGLPMGRCLGSKSGYRKKHPKSIFLPNANVFSQRHHKIWWGDLDVTRDAEALERVARRLHGKLYVLSEYDGRFKNAKLPFNEVQQRAVWCTGGAIRPPGLCCFLAKSGLTPARASRLLGIKERKLTRRLPAREALELGRKIRAFIEIIPTRVAHGPKFDWRDWLHHPSPNLHGLTPWRCLARGRKNDLLLLRQNFQFEGIYKEAFTGQLIAWFETGLEGIVWALDDSEGKGYASLHVVEEGDHLTIVDSDCQVTWQGEIECDRETGRRPRPGNPALLQQVALGRWIHWIQRGFKPDRWARYFIRGGEERLGAILRKRSRDIDEAFSAINTPEGKARALAEIHKNKGSVFGSGSYA